MNTIRTESPTPVRLVRRFLAACYAQYLRIGIAAARADAKAYAEQAEHAQAMRAISERHAAKLQRRLGAIR